MLKILWWNKDMDMDTTSNKALHEHNEFRYWYLLEFVKFDPNKFPLVFFLIPIPSEYLLQAVCQHCRMTYGQDSVRDTPQSICLTWRNFEKNIFQHNQFKVDTLNPVYTDMLKLMHFSNPFGITFILKLNLTSSWIIKWKS